jgi:hypothetical protein
VDYLVSFAGDFSLSDYAEEFEGKIIFNDKLDEKLRIDIDAYDEYTCYDVLVRELGQRDFHSTITAEEIERLAKENWYPLRIHEIYDKWWEELETHGVSRLEVKE